ncbi:MAG: cysteine desulfurase family protein, partial [Planctomycetota bacterium]
PWFTQEYGNAGSVVHPFGEAAREAVAAARDSIAASVGCDSDELVFTSGATESNNLAIRGVAEHPRARGDHLVSVATEHRAVLDPLARLARRGREVTLLGVEADSSPSAGWLDPQRVAEAITDRTCLVSVMLANNEVGVIQPLGEIGAVCRERGVPLHCDATQAVGKLPVSVAELGIDLVSFTAHKLHGPKGVGALVVRRRRPAVRLDAQVTGGGQERGRRSGTANVPAIVGFAEALRLCEAEAAAERPRMSQLRDRLAGGLLRLVDGLRVVGPSLDERDASGEPLRLGHNLNVAIDGVDGEALMLRMPRLAVSSGAACSATDPEPSHVLRALGLSEDAARCTLRLGLSRFTDAADVETAIEQIVAGVAEVRGLR